jgi:hypothetical protein
VTTPLGKFERSAGWDRDDGSLLERQDLLFDTRDSEIQIVDMHHEIDALFGIVRHMQQMTDLRRSLANLFLLAAKIGDGIGFERDGSLPGKRATGRFDGGGPSLVHAVSPWKVRPTFAVDSVESKAIRTRHAFYSPDLRFYFVFASNSRPKRTPLAR